MLKRGLVAGASTKPSSAYVCWSCELRQLAAVRAHRSYTPVLNRSRTFASTARLAQDAAKSKDDPTDQSPDSTAKSKKAVKEDNVDSGPSQTVTKPDATNLTPKKPAKGRKRLGKPVAGLARTKEESTEKKDVKAVVKPQPVAAARSKKKAASPTPKKIKLLSVRKIPGDSPRRIQKNRRIEVIRELMRKIKERSQPQTQPIRELQELKEEGVPFSKLPSNITMQDAMGRGVPAGTKTNIIKTGDVAFKAIDVGRGPVPRLSNGLDRVLFSQGITEVRDSRSRVYNFDPHLDKLIPVKEFDFSTLGTFTTPSQDPVLADVAARSGKKFVGSTSSMTGLLKHLHYLLSDWREVNLKSMSKNFPSSNHPISFTKVQKAPEAVFLRYKDGMYAVDADKSYDSGNILSMLGQYMEKLMTVSKDVIEKHRVGESHRLTEAERNTQDSYHYSTVDDFVVRSQLDAYDPRLPDEGMFDLKTRAVLPIRMSVRDHEWGMNYNIKQQHGEYESYEREYHDMARAVMLKYSLQVRLGRMGGIFVAYHNIARIFGFQYIGLDELDLILHGQRDRTLGDQELASSLRILNDVFSKAIAKWPEQSLRLHLETRTGSVPWTYIFIEPVTEEQVKNIQSAKKAQVEAFNRKILGLEPLESGKKTATASKSKAVSSTSEEAEIENAAESKAGTTTAESPLTPRTTGNSKSEPKNDENTEISKSNDAESEVTETANTVFTESQPTSPEFLGVEEEPSKTEPKIPFVAPVSTPITIQKTAFAPVKVSESVVTPPEVVADAYAQYKHDQASIPAPQEPPIESASNTEASKIESETATHGYTTDPEIPEASPVHADETPSSQSQPVSDAVTNQEVSMDDVARQAPDAAGEQLAQISKVDEFVQDLISEQASAAGGALGEKKLEQKVDDSVSSGDTKFLEKVAKKVAKVEQQTPNGPILGYVLRARSFVDGTHVDRPSNLTPDQEWTLQYTLTEIESSERAWSLYGALKTRRAALLNKSEEDDVKQGDYFIDKLKRITADSKAWRERQDAEDAGKPVVVWNLASPDTDRNKIQVALEDALESTSHERLQEIDEETIEKTAAKMTERKTKEPVQVTGKETHLDAQQHQAPKTSRWTNPKHANEAGPLQEARKQQEKRQQEILHSLSGLSALLEQSKSQMQGLYDLNQQSYNELKDSFNSFSTHLDTVSEPVGDYTKPESNNMSIVRFIQSTIDDFNKIRSSVAQGRMPTADGEFKIKTNLMSMSWVEATPSKPAYRPGGISRDTFHAAWDQEVGKIIYKLSETRDRVKSGEVSLSQSHKELKELSNLKNAPFFRGTIPSLSNATIASVQEVSMQKNTDSNTPHSGVVDPVTRQSDFLATLEANSRAGNRSVSEVIPLIDKIIARVWVKGTMSPSDGEHWVKKLLAALIQSGANPSISPSGEWQGHNMTTSQHNRAFALEVHSILRVITKLKGHTGRELHSSLQELLIEKNAPWFGATPIQLAATVHKDAQKHPAVIDNVAGNIPSRLGLQNLPYDQPYNLELLGKVLRIACNDLQTVRDAVVEKALSLRVGENVVKKYVISLCGKQHLIDTIMSKAVPITPGTDLDVLTTDWCTRVSAAMTSINVIRSRIRGRLKEGLQSTRDVAGLHEQIISGALWDLRRISININTPLGSNMGTGRSLASMEDTFRFVDSDWMSKSPASTFAQPESIQNNSAQSDSLNDTSYTPSLFDSLSDSSVEAATSTRPLSVDNQTMPVLGDEPLQDDQLASKVLEDSLSSSTSDTTDSYGNVSKEEEQALMSMDDLPSDMQGLSKIRERFNSRRFKRMKVNPQNEAGVGEGYLPVETEAGDTAKTESEAEATTKTKSSSIAATMNQSQGEQGTNETETGEKAMQLDSETVRVEPEAISTGSEAKAIEATEAAQNQELPAHEKHVDTPPQEPHTNGKHIDPPSQETQENEAGLGIFGKLKKRWFG